MKRADEADDSAQENAAPARKVRPLSPNNLRVLGYGDHNRFTVVAPVDSTPDDLANPEFWSVVSEKLNAFDICDVIGTQYWAEVLVRRSERHVGFDTIILRMVPLPPIEPGVRALLPEGHAIEYIPSTSIYEAWRTEPNRVKMGEARSWNDARQIIVEHASLR